MSNLWRTFNLPGGHPPAVPAFIYGWSRPHLSQGGCSSHGGSGFPSLGSTADDWWGFDIPGWLPPHIPLVIHGLGKPDPSHGGSPHAPASVASTLASTAPLPCPMAHEDLSGSSALDLTMSFWPPRLAVSALLVVPPPPTLAISAPPVVPPVVPPPPVVSPAPPVADVDPLLRSR